MEVKSHLCVFSAENANNSGVSLDPLDLLLSKQTPPLLIAPECQCKAGAQAFTACGSSVEMLMGCSNAGI